MDGNKQEQVSKWEEDLRERKSLLESSRTSTKEMLQSLNKREEDLKDLMFWKKVCELPIFLFDC